MNFHTEQLTHTLKAMREQEKNRYIVADYLHTDGTITLTNNIKNNSHCSTAVDALCNDYYFCTAYNASSIAFACLLNTIESNNYLATITDDDNHSIGTALKETIFGTTIMEQILDLDTTTCSIQDLRITIQEFIRKSSSTNKKEETRTNVNSSCCSATSTNRSRSSITAKRNRSNGNIDTKSPRTVRI